MGAWVPWDEKKKKKKKKKKKNNATNEQGVHKCSRAPDQVPSGCDWSD